MSANDPGVYCWLNKVNGKRYVGSTSNRFSVRKRSHIRSLKSGTHANRHLQHAWNKYGRMSFAFCILERCLPEECVEREQHWIDHYDSSNREKGYNLSPTAGSVLGIKRSELTKSRMSDSAKVAQGRPETKAKISAAHSGKSLSQETKLKLSLAAKAQMQRPGMKERLAKANLGKKVPNDVRLRISAAMKLAMIGNKNSLGNRITEEHKARIREALQGKPLTVEHRLKLSEAAKRRAATPEGKAQLSKNGRTTSAKRKCI